MSNHYAVFIRHGDYHHRDKTPGAWQPFPLNETGRSQAARCVEALLAFSCKHQLSIEPVLHTSVLQRAWQTTDIIRQALTNASPDHGYEIAETAALCERSVGSLANLSIAEIEQLVADDPRYPAPSANWKSNSHYRLPYPGAESLMQAGERVAAYINQVMHSLPTHTSSMQLFIGHGAAFRHAAYQQGMLKFEQIARLSMHHATPIYFTVDAQDCWQHQAGDWKTRQQQSNYTD